MIRNSKSYSWKQFCRLIEACPMVGFVQATSSIDSITWHYEFSKHARDKTKDASHERSYNLSPGSRGGSPRCTHLTCTSPSGRHARPDILNPPFTTCSIRCLPQMHLGHSGASDFALFRQLFGCLIQLERGSQWSRQGVCSLRAHFGVQSQRYRDFARVPEVLLDWLTPRARNFKRQCNRRQTPRRRPVFRPVLQWVFSI